MRPNRLLLAAAILLAATAANAAPATAPAKPDAPPVVVAAAKSLDDLDAFARDAGFRLPAYLTPQGIEENLAFITPGGLVRDKPIGVAVGGTADFKPDQNWALVLPLRPRVATLESLKVGDARPVPGHPDTVSWGAGTFRRTPDVLVFGPRPGVVTGLKPEALADAVKGPNALARVVVDLKAMRRSMPKAFNGLFAAADPGAAANPAQAALARLVLTPFREKLDRVEVGLDRSRESVRLLATFEPVTVPKPGKFARPGLPAGTFARVDLSVPAAQAFPAVDADLLRKALQSGGPDGKELPAAKQRDLANFLTKAAGLFLGGDATTVGVGQSGAAAVGAVAGDATTVGVGQSGAAAVGAVAGDAPTVYVVIQYTKDVDFVAGLKALAGDARQYGAAELPANRSEVTVETFTAADASKVTRVRIKGSDPAGRPIYLDAVQKGRTALLAAGLSDAHAAIDSLLAAAAKPDGEMTGVAGGWVDLGPAANAAAGLGKDSAGAFKGQRVTWTAGASGAQGLTVDVTAPPAVVTAAMKLLAPADAGPPPKPPAPKPPAPKPPARGGPL